MNGVSYTVVIERENNKPRGIIKKYEDGVMTKERAFCPLTALGEFVNENFFESKIYYMRHPFFIYTKSNPKYTGFDNLVIPHLKCFLDNSAELSLSSFEVLRQFFGLKFVLRIEHIVPYWDSIYDLAYDKKGRLIAPFNLKYDKVGCECDGVFDYNLKAMIDDIQTKPNKFIYSNCYTIADVVFSVLHYLMLNEYGFCECQGIYVATKPNQFNNADELSEQDMKTIIEDLFWRSNFDDSAREKLDKIIELLTE